VADEAESEDELSQPGFGDGEAEKELGLVGGLGFEGVFEGMVGVVKLLVDEFVADVMLVGELSDGLSVEASRARGGFK